MTDDDRQTDFEVWLAYGQQNNFIGPIVCALHDGIPTTSAEDEALFDDWEPCLPIMRVYRDIPEAKAVEANHSPSQWRDRADR